MVSKITKCFFSLIVLNFLSLPAFAIVDNLSRQLALKSYQAMPKCLHYKVKGVCFWLECDGPFCSIETTLKVEHFLPDAAVSVFNRLGENPWSYADKVLDKAAKEAGKMAWKEDVEGGQVGDRGTRDVSTHFKEVDVIGNPGLWLIRTYPLPLIKSAATAYTPYYQSLADAYMWRTPEREQALLPDAFFVLGARTVGSLINDWGPIFPRTGFVMQPADAKAAAVIAQRAADISTRSAQPHFYRPLSTSCGEDCEVASAKENDENTVQWQLIYPDNTHDTTCQVFGENDVLRPNPWGSEEAEKGGGNYVWVMWRHYSGCIQDEDGEYLGSIDF